MKNDRIMEIIKYCNKEEKLMEQIVQIIINRIREKILWPDLECVI